MPLEVTVEDRKKLRVQTGKNRHADYKHNSCCVKDVRIDIRTKKKTHLLCLCRRAAVLLCKCKNK